MKKYFTQFIRSLIGLAFILLVNLSAFAQSSDKMNYQAVIRDAANKLVVNKTVGIQINILKGSATGTNVYTETQKVMTNINGLVSLEFGGGTGFDAIDWSNGPYFIQTKIDPNGGANYTISGTTQMLSVPFALAAKVADKLKGPLDEKDPLFNAWDKSTGIKITESQITNLKHFTTADETDPIFKKWDKSSGITITESQISNLHHFTNANEIDPIFTAWNKSTGIKITESQITDLKHFTNANETDPIFGASPAKTITPANITSWNNKSNFSGSYTDLTNKPVNVSTWVNDAGYQKAVDDLDTDPENELQYLFKTDHKISLTNNGRWIDFTLQDAYFWNDSISTTHGPVVINAATGGAIKLMDGTQGMDKVLISNAQGVAHWDSVRTQNIANKAVTTPKLADYAVTTIKLAPNSVDSTKIQTGAVLSSEIRDLTIMNIDVATNAGIEVSKLEHSTPGQIIVTNSTGVPVWTTTTGDVLIDDNGMTMIVADSVTASEINLDVAGMGIIQEASGALGVNPDNLSLEATLDTIRVKDLGITTRKIATDAVTNIKMADNSVDSTNIVAGAVRSSEILDLTVQAIDLAPNSVDSTKIQTGAVLSSEIRDLTVQTIDLAPNSVDSTKIQTGAVLSSEILDLTVQAIDLAPNSVDSTKIQTGAVFSSEIADGTIMDVDVSTAAEVQIAKLAEGALDGDLIVTSGTEPVWVTMGGDVIINATGVTTITDNAVQESDLQITNAYTAGDFLTYGGADNFTWSPEVDPIYSADSAYIKSEIRALVADSVYQAAQILALNLDSAYQAGKIADLIADSVYQAAQISAIITLEDGHLYVGDGFDVAQEVELSGDVLMDNAGAVTIQNNSLGSAEISNGEIINEDISALAEIDIAKLAEGALDGDIIVTSGTEPVWVSMSGDVTINGTGVTTIEDDAVQESDLQITNTFSAGDFLTYGGADNFTWSAETDMVYASDSADIKSNIRDLIADSTYQASEILANKTRIDSVAALHKHYIGELYGGGIVFYVDQTGQHGLIASIEDVDLGSFSAWSSVYGGAGDDYGLTTPYSDNDGAANTATIVAASALNEAARLCDAYSNDGFSDWYLPAIEQLSLLYQVKYQINQVFKNIPYAAWSTHTIKSGTYWSSSESSTAASALYYNFNTNAAASALKTQGASNNRRVRAVRTF